MLVHLPNEFTRRSTLHMKSKFRSLWIVMTLLTPLSVALPGCSQADNPSVVNAPPPPAPKPEEQVAKDRGGKTIDYGANPKYKELMEKRGKYLGNPR